MRLIRRGGYHGGGIRIDKPSPDWVIIPAAEVVQARLAVVDIPAVAQGICSAEGGRHGRQLAAVLPAVGPCAVGQGIAYGVVGDGLPIERRQQVRPIGIAVGVGAACCPDVTVF